MLFGSAAAAGVMNALAGGGTLLTFPALLFVGVPAVQANATSTVALLPGALASMAGYRREVRAHASWLRTLFLPSLAGGAIGSLLLLRTPDATFAALAPWLVLFATLLFAIQAALGRKSPDAAPRISLLVASGAQLLVGIYGGFFGAGIGILMLVILGFLGLTDIHAMNGLKNFFGFSINVVAAALFVWHGKVLWPEALVMVAGATLGGYGGAGFGRRIGKEKARAAVVVIGLAMTALLFVQR